MYVFLLAGSEVVLSAIVLATCTFLLNRKKSSVPPDKLKYTAVRDDVRTEVCCESAEMDDQEEKGEREEQEKGTKKEVIMEEAETEEEKVEEVRSESVTEDSQEVEKPLAESQQNGDMASSPQKCLWATMEDEVTFWLYGHSFLQ